MEHDDYSFKVVITEVIISLFKDESLTEKELISLNRYDEPKGYDEDFDLDEFNLIGSIGITHKEVDGNLVAIQRKEIEVDDVVGISERLGVVISTVTDAGEKYIRIIDDGCNIADVPKSKCKKLGILGVSYEIVNDKIEEKE